MQKFLLRRAFLALVTLWGVTVVVFVLSRLGPDPLLVFVQAESYGLNEETIAKLRAKWGLDRPLIVQYSIWVGRVLRGDLGRSVGGNRPVTKIIGEKMPATLQLGVVAWVFSTVVGIPLGVLSAVKRATVWDYFGRFIALIGQATPQFWLALVLILIFAVQLDVLPSATKGSGSVWSQARYFVLPAAVLAFDPWATYLRLTRSSMLEVMDSEYIRLARGKGVAGWRIVWIHGLRNALIQPITTSALVFASFIHGAVFVETIFAWPGLGRLAVESSLNNDFPVLAGVVLLFGVMYVGMNFMADLAYAVIDPRIRYT